MNNQNSSNDSKNNEQSKNNESSKNNEQSKNNESSKNKKMSSIQNQFKRKVINPIIYAFKQMSDSQYKTLLIVMINVYIFWLFYLYMFNPYGILNIFPRFMLLISIIIFVFLSYICISKFEKQSSSNVLSRNIFKLLTTIGYLFFSFCIFYIVYTIFKKVLLFSSKNSFTFVIIFGILSLALLYSLNKNLKKSTNIILNILLVIPCFIVDGYNYLIQDMKDAPSSTLTLIMTMVLLFIVYVVLPYLHKFSFQEKGTIKLLEKTKDLGKEVVYVNHDELNKRITSQKPYLQREIIKQTKVLKKTLDNQSNTQESDSVNSLYNSLKNRKVYKKNSTSDYTMVKEIEECLNKKIQCEDNNIVCINPKDENDKYIVTNDHNMYEKCRNNKKGSLFSNLFNNEKSLLSLNSDIINEFEDESKDRMTFQDYCLQLNDYKFEVDCVNYKDVSNEITSSSFTENNKTTLENELQDVFVCKKLDRKSDESKYDLITGFTDICNNKETYFTCNNNNKETSYQNRIPFFIFDNFKYYSYNKDVHKLDSDIQNFDIMKMFNEKERKIIEKSMIKDDQSIKNKLEQISSVADLNQLYENYLKSNESYSSILSTIHEVNTMKNDYIYQQASNLITTINRMNKIYDYNYHYALSFWVYFDPEILKTDQENYEGMILNYGYTPYIYYHYHTKQLIIETNKCESDIIEPKEVNCYERDVIFKTSNILFQRWNLFVINYDYGTLDIFINNQLVATKNSIAPYIQSGQNTIQFGSNEKPLKYCGICNIKYYEEPLNLKKISQLYRNKLNPCK